MSRGARPSAHLLWREPVYLRRDDFLVGLAGLLIFVFWAAVIWRVIS
jgi:hypothetical protein